MNEKTIETIEIPSNSIVGPLCIFIPDMTLEQFQKLYPIISEKKKNDETAVVSAFFQTDGSTNITKNRNFVPRKTSIGRVIQLTVPLKKIQKKLLDAGNIYVTRKLVFLGRDFDTQDAIGEPFVGEDWKEYEFEEKDKERNQIIKFIDGDKMERVIYSGLGYQQKDEMVLSFYKKYGHRNVTGILLIISNEIKESILKLRKFFQKLY